MGNCSIRSCASRPRTSASDGRDGNGGWAVPLGQDKAGSLSAARSAGRPLRPASLVFVVEGEKDGRRSGGGAGWPGHLRPRGWPAGGGRSTGVPARRQVAVIADKDEPGRQHAAAVAASCAAVACRGCTSSRPPRARTPATTWPPARRWRSSWNPRAARACSSTGRASGATSTTRPSGSIPTCSLADEATPSTRRTSWARACSCSSSPRSWPLATEPWWSSTSTTR